MNKSVKLNFSDQIIEFLEGHKDSLAAEGYDVTVDLGKLTAHKETAVTAEEEQLEARAIAKQKTTAKNNAINAYYTDASSAFDSIIGALGKDNEFVQELRRLRNK